MNKINKTIIIAEAGVNHNGKLSLAYKLIDAAKASNADYVKFQTCVPKLCISKIAKKAKYQKRNSTKNENQLKMVEKISLPLNDFKKIAKYCKKRKIKFLSTAFDEVSIEYLKRFKMDFIKIPSGEITNYFYLKQVAVQKKKIILSTGLSNLSEIKSAIKILNKHGTNKKKLTVLHCNTEYPTPPEDTNLKAMLTLKKELKVKVGLSDHSLGIEAPLGAVALGASIIEKHLTINKKMKGPDHAASLEPKDFKLMVQSIRKIEKSIGDGKKIASKSEKKNIFIARKSLVARNLIKKGEKFSEINVIAKRPGNGLSPMKWRKVFGKKAKKNFKEDELIKL